MNKAKKELIDQAIASSDQHLKSAKVLLEKKFFNDSISISYYGVLDITRAALIFREVFPKSHSGTIHKFNQEFIKTNIFSKKFGKILADIEKSRIEADYNFKKDFNAKKASEVYLEAKDFVTEVEKYLEKNSK